MITGISVHDRVDWVFTITGMRSILQQRIQAGPLVASLGTRHAVVGVDLHHLPAALVTHGLKR
jgi:hypothetical protein